MRRSVLFVLGAALGLAACGGGGSPDILARQVPLDNATRLRAQSLVDEGLHHPDSSFYRMDRAYLTAEGDTVICGSVNALAPKGSFSGFTPFYVRFEMKGKRSKTKQLLIDTQIAPLHCAQIAGGVVPRAG
ncbi:MAG: hypothetical protein AAGI09_00250 [Pseudomonadota bacterium]